MGTILIKEASAIITGSRDQRVFYDADLLIEGPMVKKIGRNLSRELRFGTYEIVDGHGKYVYPGLVNTHHHFFQAFVRNNPWLDWTSMNVLEWIETIYPFFCGFTSDAIFYTALISMAELVRHGCTTAFDHQYCYPAGAGLHLVDRQMEAAGLIGMRFHAGRGANTLSREEGSPLPEALIEDTDTFLADCDRLISAYHDPGRFSMKQIVLSPCQPINCTRETFEETVKFSRNRGIRMHTHLGEGEDAAMQERYGMRTLEWCRRIGFIGSDVWYAHGWDLRQEEINIMAETGTGLAHCPAPIFLGGFRVPDIPMMFAKGVPLGIGCDGQASNDNSNLLESLRMGYMLQCHTAGQRDFPVPDPADFLYMASAGGAQLLGRNDIGALAPGMAADMFLIDVNRLDYVGTMHDPASLPVKVGIHQPAAMTIINGEIVFQDGEFLNFDETRMLQQAQDCCMDVMYRNPSYAEQIVRRLK